MSVGEPVVVQFRYAGGEYRLEVDESTAQRLVAEKDSYTPEAEGPLRLRDRLRMWAQRPSSV